MDILIKVLARRCLIIEDKDKFHIRKRKPTLHFILDVSKPVYPIRLIIGMMARIA